VKNGLESGINWQLTASFRSGYLKLPESVLILKIEIGFFFKEPDLNWTQGSIFFRIGTETKYNKIFLKKNSGSLKKNKYCPTQIKTLFY
jgi:hypothetical protein